MQHDKRNSVGTLHFLKGISPYILPHWKQLLLIFIFTLLELTYITVLPLGIKFIIDNAISKNNAELLGFILLGLLILLILSSLSECGKDYFSSIVTSKILYSLRLEMFDKVQQLPNDFFSQSRNSFVLGKYAELSNIESTVLKTLPSTMLMILQLLVNTGIAFFLDWRLGLILLIMVPLTSVGPNLFNSKASKSWFVRKEEEGIISRVVQDQVDANTLIKAYGLQKEYRVFFTNQLDILLKSSIKNLFINRLISRSSSISISWIEFLVIGLGALLTFGNVISVGTFFGFFGLLLNVGTAAIAITQAFPDLIQSSVSLNRIEQLFETPSKMVYSGEGTAITAIENEISFENVSFSYNNAGQQLVNVSLKIKVGQFIAIVGRSGAGKTTLLYLLLHFYAPDEGAVLVDGVNISGISPESLRNQMGVVFETTVLLNTTIRDNIKVGKKNATDEEVEEAARLAEIHQFISQLPNGYDTRLVEEGFQLSHGQMQRIALAQAFLRDPAVLILNEATSALDSETELTILDHIKNRYRNRTVIFVTHRLSIISQASQIFVLEHGSLVEQGKHFELLNSKGIYNRLWQKQQGFVISQGGRLAGVTPERLHSIPLFEAINEKLLAIFSTSFTTEHFGEEKTVFYQGDTGDKFYIIVRGKVEIVRKDKGGYDQQLNVLEDGDFFGEMALIQKIPRTAEVRTLTPCVFLVLYKDQFINIMENSPEVLVKIREIMDTRV